MKNGREGGKLSGSAARVDDESYPVKPFSYSRRLLAAVVFVYAGWFVSNALLNSLFPGGEGPPIAALTLASALFGLGWAAGSLSAAPGLWRRLARRWPALAPAARASLEGRGLGALATGFALVLAASHLKLCLIERVQVEGASMYPTLESGQVLWIEKISNGIDLPPLYFPFGPIATTGKAPLFGRQQYRRGDIVVFRYPGMNPENGDFFIKRIIALPGDRYAIRDGRVFVNGERLDEAYLAPDVATGPGPQSFQPPIQRLPLELNLLHPAVKHSALFGAPTEGVVPRNTVFALGDNREHSRDSRSIGFVPSFYISGVAVGLATARP